MHYILRNILLGNEKKYTNLIGYHDKVSFQKANILKMVESNSKFQKIINNIEASDLILSPEHMNILYNKVVTIYDLSQDSIQRSQMTLIAAMTRVYYC